MFGRGSSRITVARHVYLRTQQRRLRNVKSIVVRNLVLPDNQSVATLNVSVYFTLHSPHNPDKELFKSDPVQESHNPSWETVQFPSEEFSKYASLPQFIVRLWVKKHSHDDTTGGSHEPRVASHDSEEALAQALPNNEDLLAFEKTVELFDVVYLGTLVNKDGSGYPANSVIIGMFEGYYSNPKVGGVPCAPSIGHSLDNLLPPQSLLEVQRSDVCDSYQQPVLKRILNRQEVLNREQVAARECKAEVEGYLEAREGYFRRKAERDRLGMRIAQLRRQLTDQAKAVREEKEKLANSTREVNLLQKEVYEREEDLREKKEIYETDNQRHSKRGEMLVKAKKHQVLRQRNMIYEVALTFFIQEVDNTFTVCNVILPNGDQLEQPSSVEQLGVALGYVAHMVYHLGKILLIPLQYPIQPNGSRSHVVDYISDEALIENIKEFPLFMKGGSERPLFQYAVHLLNKDIAQIRQHCGYGTSKSMLKKTLPNLKSLLDRLTKDKKTKLQGSPKDPLPFKSSAPIDTSSFNDSTTTMTSGALDSVSVISSTVTGYSSSSTPTNSPAMHHESYHISPPMMSFPNQPSLHQAASFDNHSEASSPSSSSYQVPSPSGGEQLNPDRESLAESSSNYVLQGPSTGVGFHDSRPRQQSYLEQYGSHENHRGLVQEEELLTQNGSYSTGFVVGSPSSPQAGQYINDSPPGLSPSDQFLMVNLRPGEAPSSTQQATPPTGNSFGNGRGAQMARDVRKISGSSLSSSSDIAVDDHSPTTADDMKAATTGKHASQGKTTEDKSSEGGIEQTKHTDGGTGSKPQQENRLTGIATDNSPSLEVELLDSKSNTQRSLAGSTPPHSRNTVSTDLPQLRSRITNSVSQSMRYAAYGSNELGYIRTQVATPHILVNSGGGGGDTNSNRSTPPGNHSNMRESERESRGRRNAATNRHVPSPPENSDAQFLEDFIDTP